MENKKGGQQNQVVTPSNETLVNETIPKLSHQHNTAPQHLRLLQYGLKLPNHQHTSASPSYPHQQANSPIHLHMHQHVQYQQAHRHPQTSPSPNQNSVLVTNNQQYNHQHTNNSHPSYQSLPPPPLHPHSTVTQNTPQIWVPHQPPVHYHHQQQQSQNKAESFKQPSPPQLQPKPRENLERKKSGSNVSHIRSPSAKRPPEAPVAMQGWLHKQGSEGLMLWKKRWFVLSEYCLFYYKGPEEEKLLGSILLPSYKVSVCGPEDKVNKKFSFKCEHANMRTYILAADSQELMIQWIRVLNMACLLQTNIENDQKLSVNVPSTNSPSADNTDSNLMKSYQQNQNFRTTPIHMHSSSNTTDLSNPSQQELSQYNQPLYANAPPKPRRLNDGGYSSPSPDALERYGNIPNQHYLTPIQTARNVTKSPVNIYAQSIISSHSPQPEYVQLVHRPKQNVYDYMFTPTKELHNIHQTVERRTPDTYGRSKLNPSKTRNPTDYEDVYAEQSMYKRPLSPIAYTHVKKVNPPAMNSPSNPAYRAYTPVNMLGPKHVTHYGPAHIRKSPSNIARPHSADFLEYEVQHRLNGNKQQPRPKSSLDINRNRNDSDNFYSEENYAEKMRKSAQYLPKMPRYSNSSNEFVQPQQRVPNRYTGNEGSFPLMRSSTQPIQCPNAQSHSTPNNPQPTRSRSVLSEGSLSKELDFDLRSSPREYHERILSPAFVQRPENYNFNEPIRNLENEQFTRSASARVAQNNDRPQDGRLHPRDGDKKREESMKRLLEWKQRMLQSPLNRKAQVMRPVGRPEYYCKNPENGYIQREYVDPSQDKRSFNTLPQYNSYSSDDEASGSISITTRDTFPRSISAKRIWTPNPSNSQSRSSTNLARPHEDQFIRQQQQNYYISQSQKQYDLNNEQSIYNSRKDISQINDKMKVSAGELLGRTHEELVLLLIQLRRQSANTLQAIENYYNEIDTLQAQLNMMDQAKRLENLQKLEQIKQHLIELEKQYEKGKPLVNLVDNMVKLGSLYRSPNDRSNVSPYIRDRLEFNQQIQERRLLAEERRDWNRLNPNHLQLQEKVQQLYQLDRLIQEESGTLQTLQKDKEDIERALGGLRHRLNKGFNDPAEIEHARKQQIILENDLSRVHLMLAQNSKKLEETVAGNARLEQELLVLKQKLQISRQQRGSPQFSNAGDSLPCVVGTSAMLESDLQRVQQTVGDLQKQRQELSMQVRQLTDRSANLQPSKNSNATGQNSQYLTKKKINSLWRETDLDTMSIVDHGESWDNQCNSITPLYINTEIKQSPDAEMYSRSLKSSDSTSDDIQCTNFLPNEKQEIKTVRIVKRESERRQRDREKTSTGKWDALLEEDDSSQNSSVLFRPTPIQKTQSSTMLSPTFESDKNIALGRHSSISSPSLPQFTESQAPSSSEKSPELSPIFQSEAARQIITEMSIQDSPKHTNRRAVPKEKRRHYTAPHNNLIMKSLNQLPTDDNAFDRMIMNTRRARDDLDMERALKRIDAPDVVRSTLSGKELKYNESTIDNILGTPNKISIPERYIPEQLPQLSVEEQEHRLRKVESIKKMLSDTTILSSNTNNLTDDKNEEKTPSSITNKATTKMIEEKKQREHLLQLNQILAKQVMEMSKIVAVKALQKLPLQPQQMYIEEEDLSPISPLPLYQQRDNFYS